MNQSMMGGESSGNKMWMWIVIGVVVIFALGWWFWQPVLGPAEDTATSSLEKQGTSDEVSAIDADLQATDLSDLDKESADIDKVLAQ